MDASIKGVLNWISCGKKVPPFNHKGKPMTEPQIMSALAYGVKKGYSYTSQLTDEDIDFALNNGFSLQDLSVSPTILN